MPYLTFLELYKFQIINILHSVDNLNYNEALQRFNQATLKFDEYIYSIMNELIEKTEGGLQILLNRNPSINYGSILTLRIRAVKKCYDDFTLSLSNLLLHFLSGDYDGDTLNLVPLMDNSMKEIFKIFNPNNLIISKNDMKFNPEAGLNADQVLGIFSLVKGS